MSDTLTGIAAEMREWSDHEKAHGLGDSLAWDSMVEWVAKWAARLESLSEQPAVPVWADDLLYDVEYLLEVGDRGDGDTDTAYQEVANTVRRIKSGAYKGREVNRGAAQPEGVREKPIPAGLEYEAQGSRVIMVGPDDVMATCDDNRTATAIAICLNQVNGAPAQDGEQSGSPGGLDGDGTGLVKPTPPASDKCDCNQCDCVECADVDSLGRARKARFECYSCGKLNCSEGVCFECWQGDDS